MSAVARWVWEGHAPAARLFSLALAPAAMGFRAATTARTAAYDAGLLRRARLPSPVISIGNLAVGGAGKTPVASWVAGFYAARGFRPGILLRGFGGDEAPVHRRAVPEAIVIEQRDRVAAAREAVRRGAQVIVLDDGYQRLDLVRDLDIVLVATESLEGSSWTLPSGPWRESWSALARADLAVITRKRAPVAQAEQAAAWVKRWLAPGCPLALAALRIAGFRGLWSERPWLPAALSGARLLACAGIADPQSFAVQLARLGAQVALDARADHYAYGERDVRELVERSQAVDWVVFTEKDATKLRNRWPRTGREPLVATLEVVWESGSEAVEQALLRRPATTGMQPGKSTRREPTKQ